MKHIIARLHWLNGKTGPWGTVPSTARLTGYRAAVGPLDLFSVFVRFAEGGDRARIYAAFDSMVDRLPGVGERLVLTDGQQPIAECDVVDEGYDEV